MLLDRIDLRRLRCDIASAAMQCTEIKQSLRRPWTRPMGDEQRRLERLRRGATELLVLLARARGRWHVTAPPREARDAGAAWDREAWNRSIAERVALDYREGLGAPETAVAVTRPGLVDIGANLTNKAFRDDLDAVLARAAGAGVEAILVTGTSNAASRRAREIALGRRRQPSPRLFATAGIHPHQASSGSREALDEIRALAARAEVVAVGECGLDYDRDFSPRDEQRACFEAQLAIAADLGKPVFLHERDAHEDFTRILERWRPRLVGGVVHCFTGARQRAGHGAARGPIVDEARAALERYLALDLHIGITGWICDERRGTPLRALVRLVPEGRLLVETDAPYLMPRDLPDRPRTGRNEPALLPHVARTVAACRGEPPDALAAHTTAAAARLFRLPTAPP